MCYGDSYVCDRGRVFVTDGLSFSVSDRQILTELLAEMVG